MKFQAASLRTCLMRIDKIRCLGLSPSAFRASDWKGAWGERRNLFRDEIRPRFLRGSNRKFLLWTA